MTAAVRAAVADTSVRVEPTSEGFILDLGPSGGLGRAGEGVVSLTLASGQETSAPLRVKREAFSGFCLNPVLGEWGSSPLARYAADGQKATLNAARSPDAPVMGFALEGDHLVMTVTGTAWHDVQAMAWRRMESQDRTSALQDALASGTARLTPTADGFVLEIDSADLAEIGEQRAALVLDTGTVLAAPITPALHR
jgi:hypothetical protein